MDLRNRRHGQGQIAQIQGNNATKWDRTAFEIPFARDNVLLRRSNLESAGNENRVQRIGKLTAALAVFAIVIGVGIYLAQKRSATSEHPSVTIEKQPSPPHYDPPRPSEIARSEPAENSGPGGLPAFQRDKVEGYLAKHNRDLGSLLAAFHALQDTNYLLEAARNFPNDPRLQWTVLARDAFPADRRKWLDAFKASSPSNSLANYLSAQDYFKNNRPDAAIKELLASSSKGQFTDYSMDTILDTESLSQFNGRSAMETHIAAMAAMAGDNLPELADLKGVARGIQNAQQQYLNSGDAASVQNLAQAGVNFADHVMSGDSSKFIINQLVGIASETVALQNLDQNTAYDFLGGETPAQRLADLKQEKTSIQQLTAQNQNAYVTMTDEQRANYWERTKIYGELQAMRWWQQQNPATPNTGN